MKSRNSKSPEPNTTTLPRPNLQIRGVRWTVAASFAAIVFAAACNDYSSGTGYTPVDPPAAPVPRLTSVSISLPTDTIEQSQIVTAVAVGLDQFGIPIATTPAAYGVVTFGTVIAQETTGLIFGTEPGTVEITATIGGVVGRRRITVVKSPLRINEVFTNGDIPGGFVELINPSDKDIDLGGFTLGTLDALNFVVLPPALMIPAHDYRVINEINFPQGLSASDAVHLFSRFDAFLNQFSWIGKAGTDFSRCPELNGPFLVSVPTRKAANVCENVQ